jgi:hypothetical protein
VYASRAYLERHGRPDNPEDLKGHFVVACDGRRVRFTSNSGERADIAALRLRADIVAKVVLHCDSKILRAVRAALV